MAQQSSAVASAVILPEIEESTPRSVKRRQSPVSDDGAKRRRVSIERSDNSAVSSSRPPSTQLENGQPGMEGGKMEERKRGRRLFGALLGVVSQSSSSAAQQRRADIEKKQQAKLKKQDDERDERKQKELDALLEVRRQEQRVFDRQSMKIRHSNMRAQAHYLQTKATPILFYKPWELKTSDEDTINAQVGKAEDLIQAEIAQNQSQFESDGFDVANDKPAEDTPDEADHHMEKVGDETNIESIPALEPSKTTNGADTANDEQIKRGPSDQGGDGDELVEGEEDAVIY